MPGRATAGIPPMGLVLGDVHHTDTLIERLDGTVATPKLIAWKDVGTRRVRWDVVLCDMKTGIRNADLIASFLNMVRDPAWGMPAMLYPRQRVRVPLRRVPASTARPSTAASRCRATPYDAAKGILEGAFRTIEQFILSPLMGDIGGDRMNACSANLGQAPSPFDGTFEDFARDFRGPLARTGLRRGRRSRLTLMTAFSIEAGRKVVDGRISVGGELFHCDELARPTGGGDAFGLRQ